MDWSLIILGTGAEGTENLLKILGNQVLYALRFWEPSIILRQFFMTQINTFILFQKFS